MAASTGHTDIAALSAAVIAVAVALFVAPGEYAILNVVVGFSVMTVGHLEKCR
jgi:hypothetical protein